MNRTERRKKAATSEGEKIAKCIGLQSQECVPISLQQYEFAMKIANAAATGRMPRQSFISKFEEAKERGSVGQGQHYILADRPFNHALVAILQAFPDRSADGERFVHSVVHRVLLAYGDTLRDDRSKNFIFTKNGQDYVGSPLVEAIATVPMTLGEDIPRDAIFARAADLAVGWDPESDPPAF